MEKIIQYYSGYYSGSGGIETHITELVKNLDYNFEILTDALPNHNSIEFLAKNVLIKRFRPNNYSIAPFNNKVINRSLFPYRILADIIRMKNKHKYLRKSSINLVHFHNAGIGEGLTKLSYIMKSSKIFERLSNFSYLELKILTVHGLLCLLNNDIIIKRQELNFINQFENLVCVDRKLYNFLIENINPDINLSYIPNSVDTDRFSFTTLSIKKKLRVGFIGRLEYSRGVYFLYDLIRNLPNHIEVYVLGAGNTFEIQSLKSINCKSKIYFETNVDYKNIHEFYNKFDILFNPVIAEGISRVTLEAMSSGRPVIMLDIGDRYPLINNKTGYLIKNDINELLKLLLYLYENPAVLEKVAQNARELIEREYDNKVLIPKIGKIFERILK